MYHKLTEKQEEFVGSLSYAQIVKYMTKHRGDELFADSDYKYQGCWRTRSQDHLSEMFFRNKGYLHIVDMDNFLRHYATSDRNTSFENILFELEKEIKK